MQQTLDHLREMRLNGMVNELERQEKDLISTSRLSFEDRLSMAVDAEYFRRRQNKLQRFVRIANFGVNAHVEEIEYHPDRKLNREAIQRFSTCGYIDRGNNLLITGASGNGKTYIACALGFSACQHFKTVKYIRMPELLENLAIAKAQDIADYRKMVNSYGKWDLLILDEFLIRRLRPEETSDLLEVVELRSRGSGDKVAQSTIYCSQYEPSDWYPRISQGQTEHDPETEAIMERIIHNAQQISISGEMSMRQRRGLEPQNSKAGVTVGAGGTMADRKDGDVV